MKNDIATFQQFFPAKAVPYCFQLWKKYQFNFKITRPRNSKLGDYSFRRETGHQITVNGNLNAYAFTITYIHEVAHLVTFTHYKRRKEPHGKEWKMMFKKIFLPILNLEVFPESILLPLTQYLENPSASTQGCIPLSNALRTFDEPTHAESRIPLTEVEEGKDFVINGRSFIKGELRRTRFLCTEKATGKRYVVAANALVELL
ncbi:MAG: SprT-like domain-containing protein [Flectobacillus sp.]|uniref:SprT-like domain-containing protein n=1 Tax=Flectobacillus sp. TaxID=50419 RepID=UPI003B98EBBD